MTWRGCAFRCSSAASSHSTTNPSSPRSRKKNSSRKSRRLTRRAPSASRYGVEANDTPATKAPTLLAEAQHGVQDGQRHGPHGADDMQIELEPDDE